MIEGREELVALLLAARAGSSKALDRLIKRTWKGLIASLHGRWRVSADVEDAVMQSYMDLLQTDFVPECPFLILRKKARERLVESYRYGPQWTRYIEEEQAAEPEDNTPVNLGHIPEQAQMVLAMQRWGCDGKGYAKDLGISYATLKRRIAEGREQLGLPVAGRKA